MLATVTIDNIEECYELLVILRNIKFDDSGCWLWQGWLDKDGYARSQVPGTRKKARTHRLMYERLVGYIPKDMVLHHTCRIRNCVNPDHLVIMTHEENVKFQNPNSAKTHCPQGHEYSFENTYISKHNTRTCRKCRCQRVLAARKALAV